MFIHFDERNLHVQVVCGTLEEYKPDESIKDLQAKVNDLQEDLRKFQAEKVAPKLEEIKKIVNEKNKKHTEKQSEEQ